MRLAVQLPLRAGKTPTSKAAGSYGFLRGECLQWVVQAKPALQSTSANKVANSGTVDFAYKLSQHFGPILSHWFKDKFAYSVVDKSTALACS